MKKWTPEPEKIDVRGGSGRVWGRSCGRSCPILAPSCVWKPIWPFLAGPGRAKLEPRWAQKAPRGAKLGPRWWDVAAKRRQEAPKRGYLAPCWELLGRFGEHFGDILPKRPQSKKLSKTLGFLRFWLLCWCPGGGLEASWKSRWPVLASSWASMLHFRAMLGHLGAKMANKMGKMTAKSAKMSQDGPTWTEKAIDPCTPAEPTGQKSGRRRPPRKAF